MRRGIFLNVDAALSLMTASQPDDRGAQSANESISEDLVEQGSAGIWRLIKGKLWLLTSALSRRLLTHSLTRSDMT